MCKLCGIIGFMKYTKETGKIVIHNLQDFNIKHILECGQVFRFKNMGDYYEVVSAGEYARIFTRETEVVIECTDEDYFEHYFDLKTNYGALKTVLSKNKTVADAIDFGYGMRILRQYELETIIGFIISANNNIKRIQNSMHALSEYCGQKIEHPKFGTYYAFPTIEQLSKLTVEDFVRFGTGYRAQQLKKAVEQLQQFDLFALHNMPTQEAIKALTSLTGVGAKVADCILLFAYYKMNVFPIDTWSHKIYNNYFAGKNLLENRAQIRAELLGKFKNLSGYAQQYLFYFEREKGKKCP